MSSPLDGSDTYAILGGLELPATTVLANGCFDVLHIGHVLHLEAASELGDELVVALTVDDCVNKPGQPIHNWNQRRDVLMALRCVDRVVPSRSCAEAVRWIRPSVLVKGIDYLDSDLLDEAKAACIEVGAQLHITNTPKFSSRDIIRRIKADVA